MSTQKRISAPKTYNIKRKQGKWVISANPGPHSKKTSIPVGVLLRDLLGITRNLKETKKVLSEGKVLVDGKVRKTPKYPIGCMDVVEIPLLKKAYRLIYDNNGRLMPAETKEKGQKVVKIKSKIVKGKKFQYTTDDGRTIITDKSYKIGDSLLIELPSQKVMKHLPFGEGALSYIVSGKHVGKVAKIKAIENNQVVLDIEGKEERTIKDYVCIIPKVMWNE